MNKVVEELCGDPECPREGTHWHEVDLARFASVNGEGEYTLTLRVRRVTEADRQREARERFERARYGEWMP